MILTFFQELSIQSNKDFCLGKNTLSALQLLKTKIMTLGQFVSSMVHSDLIFRQKSSRCFQRAFCVNPMLINRLPGTPAGIC